MANSAARFHSPGFVSMVTTQTNLANLRFLRHDMETGKHLMNESDTQQAIDNIVTELRSRGVSEELIENPRP